MLPPYAARKDRSQALIVEGLRRIGAKVIPTSQKGVPDLSVGYQGVNYYLEVKDEKGKLTPAQVEFFDMWPGQAAIVRNLDEALRVLGAVAD